MNRKTLVLLIAVVTLTVGIALAKLSRSKVLPMPPPNSNGGQNSPISDYSMSGPFVHENLTIFLIHGPDQPNNKLFVPLQEAMERKVVIVHETSNVNELAIENVSQTDEVFVQAGDIVKGGQQDRVLAVDLIMPARSGKISIDAFCVEQDRWRRRGVEPAAQFNSSNDMVATKDLKMAAKQANSQTKVWREVDAAQAKLSTSLRTEVRSDVSPSSLQLVQENEKVQESIAAYLKGLSGIVDGKDDVIGYVFAINDKINSADLYASSAQLKRFWPKLLKTTAIEAVAERDTNEKSNAVSIDAIKFLFANAERGEESTRDITQRTRMLKREGGKAIFFETRDMAQNGAWIHRSYLAK